VRRTVEKPPLKGSRSETETKNRARGIEVSRGRNDRRLTERRSWLEFVEDGLPLPLILLRGDEALIEQPLQLHQPLCGAGVKVRRGGWGGCPVRRGSLPKDILAFVFIDLRANELAVEQGLDLLQIQPLLFIDLRGNETLVTPSLDLTEIRYRIGEVGDGLGIRAGG
jgi:hypothetical protein